MPLPPPDPSRDPILSLLELMAALRHPEQGCPWDIKQDFATIAPYTLEEAYEVLDAILKRYVEEDASVADMVAEGFEEAVVRKVIRLVDLNEYKRRQAAVGPRITARNFGKDRRYPITSGFGKQNW